MRSLLHNFRLECCPFSRVVRQNNIYVWFGSQQTKLIIVSLLILVTMKNYDYQWWIQGFPLGRGQSRSRALIPDVATFHKLYVKTKELGPLRGMLCLHPLDPPMIMHNTFPSMI